jgi:hypothetical protein
MQDLRGIKFDFKASAAKYVDENCAVPVYYAVSTGSR